MNAERLFGDLVGHLKLARMNKDEFVVFLVQIIMNKMEINVDFFIEEGANDSVRT